MLTDTFTAPSPGNGQDNVISLEATVPAARGGGSGKLVFEDQTSKTPDAVVAKAMARASVWFEQLTAGKAQSMAEIALRENITDNYVSNLIHLAWLSGFWTVIRSQLRWRGSRCSRANPIRCGDADSRKTAGGGIAIEGYGIGAACLL
jgi:hypothetical protein